MNPNVDWYFDKDTPWKKEYQELRKIVIECALVEELKWGVPCYTFNQSNIVLIHGFKNYCALLFHKGALLKDSNTILIQQTKHVQAARQIRFASLQDIRDLKPILKAYIFEAIEVEKAGLQVKMKPTSAFEMPKEFETALQSPELKSAFYSLTSGRQRGYLLYFAKAKQSKTRQSRIEKSIPKILKGKGLNEDYKKPLK
ncbi:DUF1801 domain-containing protein [Bizionia paragorgiae]|uniref:YdeI/OmpD-associated family protein n=1 Tax=Bizionia paragorgiae TaxID=283786 RepID=UPI00299E4611|nr:DUF1801 domain-containing protein [Bizionia paragorgiae]MDX1272656.1 DUF1801 domain-containing protein [Bizionia paragorgiae]